MKCIINLLFIIILCNAALAQTDFNVTFQGANPSGINKYSLGQKVTIIPYDENNEADDLIIFTGNNIDPQSGNFTSVELTATDFAGNYLYSSTIKFPLDHHHIIKTRNNDLLFAGYSSDLQYNDQLWVMKLDQNFNLILPMQRIYIYPKNPISGLGDFENIDIEAIVDEHTNTEYYFITFTEGNRVSGLEDLPTLGIARLDENLNLLWHNTYENSTVSYQAHVTTAFRPFDGSDIQISIAGTLNPLGGVNPFWFRFPRPTYMTIDLNGVPQTPFTGSWPLSDNERMPDIIWDGDHFVSVFTSGTGSKTTNPYYPTSSTIGIYKMDLNYNVVEHGFYWSFGLNFSIWGDKNIGSGITLDQNGDYIISGYIHHYEGVPSFPSSTWLDYRDGPIIVRSKKNDPLNINLTAHHLHFFGNAGSLNGDSLIYHNQFHISDKLDNSILVPTKIEAPQWTKNPRLIKTNTMINDCYHFESELINVQDYIVTGTWGFKITNLMEIVEDHIQIEPSIMQRNFCPYPRNKTTPVNTALTKPAARLYPTLITDGDRAISCELDGTDEITVVISNTLGQVLTKQTIGKTGAAYSIPTGQLQKGVNFINIYSRHELLYSGKLVKE